MKYLSLILLSLAGAALTHAAPLNYNFSVDTSSISGQTGAISFQLSTLSPDSTTASIAGLPAPLSPFTLTVDVAGNPTSENMFFNFTFGNSFQFLLTLSGPGIESPTDPANFPKFSLQMPLLSATELISIEVVPGIGPLETFDPLVSQVPEPGTAWLFLLAAPVLARRLNRR
jgi:hypothetical protein